MTKRFTDADLASIMVKQGHAVDFKFRKNRKATQSDWPSESQMQQDQVKWWATVCHAFQIPENMLMAFPLQGHRTPRNGARMKKEGCRAGTPDMFLAVKRNGFSGLWVENKTPDGVVSPAQIKFLSDLSAQGYMTLVVRSNTEFFEKVTAYITS